MVKVKKHGFVALVEQKVQNGWANVPLVENGTQWLRRL
jgi:hypothetical protein